LIWNLLFEINLASDATIQNGNDINIVGDGSVEGGKNIKVEVTRICSLSFCFLKQTRTHILLPEAANL
jgi:hypothetical protein